MQLSARGLRRFSALAAAVAVVALAAGCGDDDDDGGDAASTTPEVTETEPTTETETAPTETVEVPDEETETETEPPPEEQPGGAGDEEPIRSQVELIGRGGRIGPQVARVPPFIAVRVLLRSADGGDYGLDCGGRTVQVDADIASASTRIAGRRPDQPVKCRPLGDHNGVAILPSAEPGP
jgi:hypothetical protein